MQQAISDRGLHLSGYLVALQIKPNGLPRRKREPIQQELKRLHGKLLERAVQRQRLRRGRDFDPANLLIIPYEIKERIAAVRGRPNLIVNTGEAFLVDAWQNLVELENMKFHGIGTGTVAAAEGDTALGTEITTQYNPDNTRATGSLTEVSASVFRTVGTNSVDAVAGVTEWGLFSQAATGGGTMFSRVVFTAINLGSGDSLQTTYDLTVE